MQTNLRFGMLQTVYTAEEEIEVLTHTILDKEGNEIEQKEQVSKRTPVRCADRKCGRLVVHDAPCFIDASTGEVWCDDCGKCERYARKKAAERAEYAAKTEAEATAATEKG